MTTVREITAPPDRTYKGYIFDLDGTIYLGSQLLPGAREVVLGLRERGSRVLFVTNNPTRDPQMYARKLTDLGIGTDPADVVNTVVTMTAWLVAQPTGTTAFVMGEEPLLRSLADAGVPLSEAPDEIDVVVASYDRTFDYRKLQIAFDALTRPEPARLVTTNPDVYCPFPGGRGEPDAGAIVAAIEACTGQRCSVNTGKPDRIMLETAMGLLDLDAQDCLMVGDRLSTDIAMAVSAGMDSALVLTGEATLEAARSSREDQRPSFVLDRIDQLLL